MSARWGRTASGQPVLMGRTRAVFIPPDGQVDSKGHDFEPCNQDHPCTDPEVCHLELDLPAMCRAAREEHV